MSSKCEQCGQELNAERQTLCERHLAESKNAGETNENEIVKTEVAPLETALAQTPEPKASHTGRNILIVSGAILTIILAFFAFTNYGRSPLLPSDIETTNHMVAPEKEHDLPALDSEITDPMTVSEEHESTPPDTENTYGMAPLEEDEEPDPDIESIPSMDLDFEEERGYLPEVTDVEVWQQYGEEIGNENNFAPSVVALNEGGYRIFWNDFSSGGITSASSEDGINWEADEGIRVEDGDEGEEDCVASHPWVIAMSGGYRMYYQANKICDESDKEFRIYSAFSEDGLNFEKEGLIIDIGEENGLTQAAHGRAIQLEDGTYRMFFSANFIGKDGPADVLGASSQNGLDWVLDEAPTVEMGHDPALVQIGDEIHMYMGYLGHNTLHLVSTDGYNFEPIAWLQFYNTEEQRFEGFGDIETLLIDSELLIYGGGKVEGEKEGVAGQVIMKQDEGDEDEGLVRIPIGNKELYL